MAGVKDRTPGSQMMRVPVGGRMDQLMPRLMDHKEDYYMTSMV